VTNAHPKGHVQQKKNSSSKTLRAEDYPKGTSSEVMMKQFGSIYNFKGNT